MTVLRDDVVSSHVPRQIQNPTIIGVFYARPVVARGVVLGSHDTYIESDSDGTCCTSNLRVDFRVADNAREFTQEVVADGEAHISAPYGLASLMAAGFLVTEHRADEDLSVEND